MISSLIHLAPAAILETCTTGKHGERAREQKACSDKCPYLGTVLKHNLWSQYPGNMEKLHSNWCPCPPGHQSEQSLRNNSSALIWISAQSSQRKFELSANSFPGSLLSGGKRKDLGNEVKLSEGNCIQIP